MTQSLNVHVADAVSAARLRKARRWQSSAGLERPRRSPVFYVRRVVLALGVVR